MTSTNEMEQRERCQSALAVQATFARGYSPLSAAFCEHASAWIADAAAASARLPGDQADVTQSVQRIADRIVAFMTDDGSTNELQPMLRMGATLHAFVLDGDPRCQSVRPYYHTTGGDRRVDDGQFEVALFETLRDLGDDFFERAHAWRVQTNESSRGLAWLLPAVVVGAEAVHLVELGASAGLNLYAEHRAYDIVTSDDRSLRLGRASDRQFRIKLEGETLPVLDDQAMRGPEVLSRVGVDAHPLDLTDPKTAAVLMACIWGDQPSRFARLREGLAVHSKAIAGELAPTARVEEGYLPDDAGDFLRGAVPLHPEAPVICFNTYVTAYFNDVQHRALQRAVAGHARSWSLQHHLPWMWVRFEPPRRGEDPGPHSGWCRWRVETWLGDEHHVVDIGWAHPHMRRIVLSDGLSVLRALGQQ